jgi:hypothetical protein
MVTRNTIHFTSQDIPLHQGRFLSGCHTGSSPAANSRSVVFTQQCNDRLNGTTQYPDLLYSKEYDYKKLMMGVKETCS